MEHPDPASPESFSGGSVVDPPHDPSREGRLARKFWAGSSLNVVVHGPGPVAELAALVQAWAPELRGRPMDDLGLLHVTRDDRAYVAVFLTGEAGSAFVLSDITTPPDEDTTAIQALFPIRERLGDPVPTADGTKHWRTSLFSRGHTDEWAVADALRAGRVVPITQLAGFVTDAPTDPPADPPTDPPADAPTDPPADPPAGPAAGSTLSDDLTAALLAAGWEPQAPSSPGRTNPEHALLATIREDRPVFFGTRNDGWLRWACPVTTDPNRATVIRAAPPDLPEPVTLHLPTPERPDSVVIELQLPVDPALTADDVEQAAVGLVRLAAAIDGAAAINGAAD